MFMGFRVSVDFSGSMGFWVYRFHGCRLVSMGVLPGVLNFRIEFFIIPNKLP